MKIQKKWIVPLAAAALVITAATAALIILSFLRWGPYAYAVNREENAAGLAVSENFHLYSGDKIGFSFLYPKGRTVSWSAEDGAYIYGGEEGQAPYVLVCRTNRLCMSPEQYFRTCDTLMLQEFADVQSTPIQQVELGEKTLYLVRYFCDGLVIDRYLELYGGFYLQYTAVSREAGSLDTELYYAISTLRTAEGAYAGAYSGKASAHSHDDLRMRVDIPDMLAVKDLTIGYFASGDSAVMLAVCIAQDDNGKAIYNRRDFIDRAAEAPDFVAGLLGADAATFTEGAEKTFNGKSFYCYPMQMQAGGEAYTGQLCLANADETGCWLVCYAVRSGCPAFDQTLALLEKSAASIEIR